jgi:hypothetical protein
MKHTVAYDQSRIQSENSAFATGIPPHEIGHSVADQASAMVGGVMRKGILMGFGHAVKLGFSNYLKFSDRAC